MTVDTVRIKTADDNAANSVIADVVALTPDALTPDALTVGVALCELAIQGLTSEPSADRTIPAYQDVLCNPLQVPPSDVNELSVRERQVFALLGAGLSNRQIGRRLDVTERTVKDHVGRILAKLGLESRLQAGLAALVYLVDCGRYGRLLPVTSALRLD
jgi:DNA-binding NarL/FixJ family response regulator